MQRSSILIYDIKAFDLRTRTTTHFGYAVFPLIVTFQSRLYLVSGLYLLPVYKGPVSKKLLQRVMNEPDTESRKIISELLKAGDMSIMGGTQLIAKVVDA